MYNDTPWKVIDRTECIDDDEYIKSLEETCAWYHERAEERERLLKEVRSQALGFIFTIVCVCIFFCFIFAIRDYTEMSFFNICQICLNALLLSIGYGIIIALCASAINFCFQIKVHQTRYFKIILISIAVIWGVLSVIGFISYWI